MKKINKLSIKKEFQRNQFCLNLQNIQATILIRDLLSLYLFQYIPF